MAFHTSPPFDQVVLAEADQLGNLARRSRGALVELQTGLAHVQRLADRLLTRMRSCEGAALIQLAQREHRFAGLAVLHQREIAAARGEPPPPMPPEPWADALCDAVAEPREGDLRAAGAALWPALETAQLARLRTADVHALSVRLASDLDNHLSAVASVLDEAVRLAQRLSSHEGGPRPDPGRQPEPERLRA